MARTLKTSNNGPEHNSGSNSADSIYARRIIKVEEEIRALKEDVKEIYAEAKEADVRVKPIRLAVKLYFDPEHVRVARAATQDAAEIIIHALGGYADTPLGEAAVKSAGKRSRNPQKDIEDAIEDGASFSGSDDPWRPRDQDEPPEAA
jgi:uncharacterized protein (UPF0335 family)